MIFNRCTKRNNRAFEWLSQPPFIRCFHHLPRGLGHFENNNSIPQNQPTIFRPSLMATILQTFLLFILRTALSAILFVSDRWSVDVQWFHDTSSQDLPNYNELSQEMTFGLSDGSWNFRKLLSVSWEVFVLHGYDFMHWVAKSCTEIAYRWLFPESPPSLKTLWSAVIKSSNFSARSTASPVRFLRRALVILVRLRTSQFWSLGKWA